MTLDRKNFSCDSHTWHFPFPGLLWRDACIFPCVHPKMYPHTYQKLNFLTTSFSTLMILHSIAQSSSLMEAELLSGLLIHIHHASIHYSLWAGPAHGSQCSSSLYSLEKAWAMTESHLHSICIKLHQMNYSSETKSPISNEK